MSSEVKSERD